jgi:DNA-binding CsgD family transcriptional regulator
MPTSELQQIGFQYYELLQRQEFNEADLDYSLLEQHKGMLNQLAKVGNSGITVFDMYKKKHVFTSYNFENLFGHELDRIETQGNEYFDSKVHPDDMIILMKNGIAMLEYAFEMPSKLRLECKLINEYRIKDKDNNYVRVIEQHQNLELDRQGNMWLSLSIIDISPNQDDYSGVKSQVVNFKTGQLLPIKFGNDEKPELSTREKEVLSLVKHGLLSKEISEKLFISIHTVNTHRQRILEKLGVDNSVEAIGFASKLGLIR